VDDIQRAQVEAGEKVIVERLRQKGLLPPAPAPLSANPHPLDLVVNVVCNPCGSLIAAQWTMREEAPKEAILCVEKCRCAPAPVSDEAIDEAVAQLLEMNGTLSSGWEWRSLRDHARETEQIIRQMLAGELTTE
jgi:hypothetical protein